jgi:hypothetical protein
MRPLHRFLLLSAVVPLSVAGCSGSSSPSATRATASPTPAATQGPLVAASAYEVTAGKGITDADLKAALTSIAKLPGVTGTSLQGGHRLRADLNVAEPKAQRDAVIAALMKLGVVTVGR